MCSKCQMPSGTRILSINVPFRLGMPNVRCVTTGVAVGMDPFLIAVSDAMHPPLSLHKHPGCAEIISLFTKCHEDHPFGKFFGKCTDLKLKLDKCFREEKAVKRKANYEESKRYQERLRAKNAARKAAAAAATTSSTSVPEMH